MSTLDSDFEVMYIVSTEVPRELGKDEFIKWAKELEYKNIKFYTIEGTDALREFSVRAFPTNVILNTKGEIVLNQAGLFKAEQVVDFMKKVD